MFRQPSDVKKFGTKSINCLIADNGIGDMLAAFPAINYIAETYSWIKLLVWVPDHMLTLAQNTLSPKTIVRNYTDAKTKYDDKRGGITTKWDRRVSPMRIHPVDYAFITLADDLPDIKHKNYPKINDKHIDLTKFNLPEKFVVIQATATETVKSMPIKTANDLSKYVISKGYTPVYLGKTLAQSGHKYGDKKAHELDIDKSLGLDLVDKASLLESVAILNKAKCFVGVDGGLMHMAGFCPDLPIIAGYTFIDPWRNLPIRNNEIGWRCYPIVPDESLGCRYCQTNINFTYGYDHRDCIPYDDPKEKYLCIKQMTADKFISILEAIL